MFELPLFPLNTVLFPGMPINLQIFEERYKEMINLCIEKRQPFGVLLISNNEPDTSHVAEPYLIGCSAQITQVQPLGQGRMNITAVGRERFKVITLHHDKSYLTGTVESFPLADDDREGVFHKGRILRRRLENYLDVLQTAGQLQYDAAQLPNDSTAIAYLAAVLLRVEAEQKQELLSMDRTSTMLTELIDIYRREIALLGETLNPPEHNDYNNFSLN